MAPNSPSDIANWHTYHERQRQDGTGAAGSSATQPPPPATVDHPAHYNQHPAGIECIAVVEAFSFNIGNAIKYLWRAGLKPGTSAAEDLQKAAWYVAREIERRAAETK